MMRRPPLDLPFHFGTDNALLGLYHPAISVTGKAVLLCPPLGQELIRCHRLYRQLACMLAGQGHAVLRFDYYGSGDSAGDSRELDWDRCLADVRTAADELRRRSGCEHIVGFGARLGGNLVLAAAEAARFARVIAWDPIPDGRAHVAQLDAMQAALQTDSNRFLKPRTAADVAGQWLGFTVSSGFRQQLGSLTLPTPATSTLLIHSGDPDLPHEGIVTPDERTATLQTPTPWDDPSRLELALISHELIQTVTRHLQASP